MFWFGVFVLKYPTARLLALRLNSSPPCLRFIKNMGGGGAEPPSGPEANYALPAIFAGKAVVSCCETRWAGDARIPAVDAQTAGMRAEGVDRTDGRRGPGGLELNRAGWAASARGPKWNLESGCRSWHGITNWQTVNAAGIGWLARLLCSHVTRFSEWFTYKWDQGEVEVGGPSCRSWRRNRCTGTVKLDSSCPCSGSCCTLVVGDAAEVGIVETEG